MFKNVSIKVLSILLTTCISSSMFAVSATALNNEKQIQRLFLFKKAAKKQFHQKKMAELII